MRFPNVPSQARLVFGNRNKMRVIVSFRDF